MFISNNVKITLSFILILLFAFLPQALATTYYSIKDGDWDDPSIWSLVQEGSPGTQVPADTDDVVIGHNVSQHRSSGYTFYGEVRVELAGHLTLSTGNANSTPYIYGGSFFEVLGQLTTSSDFHHQIDGSNGDGLFYAGPSAILSIGNDLILNAFGNTIIENAACGSGLSVDDVYFVGEDARICGNGSYIVPHEIRLWDSNGNEVTDPTTKLDMVQSQMCSGFSFYNSATDCVNDNPMASGTGSFSLPVEWLDFTVEESGAGVQINWSTARETNNNYFEIEKSVDGNDFQQLGHVEAVGNSEENSYYGFFDRVQHRTTSYYRIRQIDIDGKFSFSPIIEYTPQMENTILAVYPNPCKGDNVQLQLPTSVLGTSDIQIKVRDMSGRLVFVKELGMSNGNNLLVSGMNLSPGMYALEVGHEGGSLKSKFFVR